MKKSIVTMGLVVALSMATSITALAAEWQQDEVGFWYQNDDGSYTMNGWQEINNHWFYFNDAGYMLVETWTPDNYYVGFNGAWVEDVDKYQKSREQAIADDLADRKRWGYDDGSPLGTYWISIPGLGTLNSSDPRAAAYADGGNNGYDSLSDEAKKELDNMQWVSP